MPAGLCVGIDVSKETLDVGFVGGGVFDVGNTEAGIADIVARLDGLDVHRIVLEASGGYERKALVGLFTAGLPVAVVQPQRARQFARGMGFLAKTDAIDAQMLAQMGAAKGDSLRLWAPRSESELDVEALVKRRRQLRDQLTAEKRRLEHARSIVRDDINQSIGRLSSQIAAVEEKLRRTVASDSSLQADVETLEQIKGIGFLTATTLRISLPELGAIGRNQIAALAGVAPINRDSGTYRGRRRITGGRPDARCSLYMATVTATCHNPVIRPYFQRLRARGKEPKVAMVACMRKLLIHANSLMRRRLEALKSEAPSSEAATA